MNDTDTPFIDAWLYAATRHLEERQSKIEVREMWQNRKSAHPYRWVPFRVAMGDFLEIIADKIRGFSRY